MTQFLEGPTPPFNKGEGEAPTMLTESRKVSGIIRFDYKYLQFKMQFLDAMLIKDKTFFKQSFKET